MTILNWMDEEVGTSAELRPRVQKTRRAVFAVENGRCPEYFRETNASSRKEKGLTSKRGGGWGREG